MPYPNFHACRIEDPSKFSKIRYKSQNGADVLMGQLKGSSEWKIQAIRYPKDKWGAEKAAESCKGHGGTFEAASGMAMHSDEFDVPAEMIPGLHPWVSADGDLPEEAVRIFEEAAQHVKCYAQDMRGVEIFAAGTWNGDTYTEGDLDRIVDAYKEMPRRPPLKLGHTEAQKFFGQADGHPALGWVDRVYRNGKKLLADFTNIPDTLMGMIRNKAYDRVSAEIYWNYKLADGKVLPRALKAVSILGADWPGVTNLQDLQAALMGEADRLVKAYGDGEAQVKIYELDLSGSKTKEGGSGMDERQYTEKIASLETQLGAEKRTREDWETRALRAEATLSQRDEDFAIKQFREVLLPQLKKEGKVTPAEEETLVVTFTSIQPGVRKYAGADVNPREMFVKSLNDRKPLVNFREQGAGGEDDLVRDGETPATAVDRTIRKFVDTKEAKDYADGKELVKTRFPQLWERYIRT